MLIPTRRRHTCSCSKQQFPEEPQKDTAWLNRLPASKQVVATRNLCCPCNVAGSYCEIKEPEWAGGSSVEAGSWI